MNQNIDSKIFKGSCLCQAVKYRIESSPKAFYFCHCQQCRKLTGSAMATNIQLEIADINWLSGEDKINRFDHPGDRMFSKVFCKTCGSALPYVNENKTALVIPAGSLDSDLDIAPEVNIFWEDKASWYESGVNARCCEGFDE